jgi:hypothetical protein
LFSTNCRPCGNIPSSALGFRPEDKCHQRARQYKYYRDQRNRQRFLAPAHVLLLPPAIDNEFGRQQFVVQYGNRFTRIFLEFGFYARWGCPACYEYCWHQLCPHATDNQQASRCPCQLRLILRNSSVTIAFHVPLGGCA